jgi:hypothetical protein
MPGFFRRGLAFARAGFGDRFVFRVTLPEGAGSADRTRLSTTATVLPRAEPTASAAAIATDFAGCADL